ncbi:MAG: glycerol-3-phosphate dehydrogenase subunit GlpB [Chloroflexi bacterium]|nr:glycerol-3-phosphate dehydrogenase subunit GlpB [Chloroflexota bacterium]MBP8058814.1 glycerol-3-phosphate dehydrogenase subunit GlpB [Chloroflexota bacterium]
MKAQQDVLVIGAGLAGLVAAWHAAASSPQSRVRLISKGWGATHWHSGCIDVLGYYPFSNNLAVEVPLERLRLLFANEPHHPYTLAGVETIAAALTAFQQLCQVAGYPLHGSLEQNWLLPTAVGALRPTCLAPQTMIAGSAHDHSPVVIVGLAGLLDFYPEMIAANLAEQGIPAQALMLELAAMTERHFNNPITLARQMEQSKFRDELVQRLRNALALPALAKVERVGLPAVLGLEHAAAIHTELETALGRRVFEIPGLPPSVAGIRLHTILVNAIRQAGGEVYDGMKAIGAECAEGRVVKVMTEAAGRARPHRADRFVLATGGILGGGIVTDYAGRGREAVFDLPLTLPTDRRTWFKQDFMDADGHPIYRAGIHVNAEFQPINENNQPLYHNLYAIGTTLAHAEAIRERSFEGIALTTGYFVGKAINS